MYIKINILLEKSWNELLNHNQTFVNMAEITSILNKWLLYTYINLNTEIYFIYLEV